MQTRQKGYAKINKELILSELIKSREAIDAAIAYVKSDTAASVSDASSPVKTKFIRAGEGRAVAILSRIRDAGGVMQQLEFEDNCLRNCRTLVGAGGFIARGSIIRESIDGGGARYILTDKGKETVDKWEARYGKNWEQMLEPEGTLGNTGINDHQKLRLVSK